MLGSLLVITVFCVPFSHLIARLIGKCIHAVISVKAQVICRASVNCNGQPGDDLGVTTERGCCIDNPNGLAYSVPGGESCTPCIGESE